MDAPSQTQALNSHFLSSQPESQSYNQNASTAEVPTLESGITSGVTENTVPHETVTLEDRIIDGSVTSVLYNGTYIRSVHDLENLSSTEVTTFFDRNTLTATDIDEDTDSNSKPTSLAFNLHVYVFTTLFISLDLLIMFVCLTSKRRVVSKPAPMIVLLLNAIFCTNFVILLLADPYRYRHIFPSMVITFIIYFKFLCFVISFWLIQILLKSLSTMKQIDPRTRLKRYRAFAFLCLGYTCVMVTTCVVTSKKPNLHALHLLPQAIYVAAIIVLCFTFLYSALNISHYAKQTCRVLDESITYSKMQNHLKRNGRHADVSLDLYRVKRGKLGYEADMSPDDALANYYPNGNFGNDSESSSNESLTFCNEVAFTETGKIEEMFQKRKNGFRAKQQTGIRNGGHNFITMEHQSQNYAILESTSDCDFFTEDSEILSYCDKVTNTNPPQDPHMHTIPAKLKKHKNINRSITTVFCNNAFNPTSAEGNNPDCVEEIPEQHQDDDTSFQAETTLHTSSDIGPASQCETSVPQRCTRRVYRVPVMKLGEVKTEDNGYLADTENAVLDDGIELDDTVREMENSEPMDNDDKNRESSGQNQSLTLPQRYGNYLGLQRVRKGRSVRKVMQVTYCTAIFAFLLCVLELYEMFSVRGVLTGLDSSSPLTWLLFQSFMRVSELGFSTTVMRSIQILGRKRRPFQRKKTKTTVHLNGHYQRREIVHPSSEPLCSAETSPV